MGHDGYGCARCGRPSDAIILNKNGIFREAEGGPVDISIVICTHNRCASLKKTLDSIADMDVPGSLSCELIVVDNNSNDGTKSVIESFASRSGLNVRYVFEGKPGLSIARNCGIYHSRGEIVSFTDDDVLVSGDWVTQLKRAFDEYRPACLGGKILLDRSLPLPSWWDQRWRSVLAHFDRGDEVVIAGPDDRTEFAWGANVSFRREVFEKYGLFRTNLGRTPNSPGLGEDSEFVLRLRQNGERIVYYPGAVVIHSPSVERLSKRYLRRWNYCLGVSTCLIDMEFPKHWPRILRIPRWRYGWALKTLWDAVRYGLASGSHEAFNHQLNLMMLLGYAVTAVRTRRESRQVVDEAIPVRAAAIASR